MSRFEFLELLIRIAHLTYNHNNITTPEIDWFDKFFEIVFLKIKSSRL